ncbi:MAG: hypothetical protein WCI51_09240 [Lentisphaerota bacterium]
MVKQNIAIIVTAALFMTGCGTVPVKDEPPVTRMLDGNVTREISDKMMRSLLNSKVISGAGSEPKIAMLQFRNKSRFPLDGSIFLNKLRADLNSQATGRIIFLDRANILAIKNERAEKRNNVLSFNQQNVKQALSGADYFLAGEMRSISGAANGARSEYVLFSFYLVNAENTDILWEDQFDLDFKATENVVYR